jgi:hypothetical protein
MKRAAQLATRTSEDFSASRRMSRMLTALFLADTPVTHSKPDARAVNPGVDNNPSPNRNRTNTQKFDPLSIEQVKTGSCAPAWMGPAACFCASGSGMPDSTAWCVAVTRRSLTTPSTRGSVRSRLTPLVQRSNLPAITGACFLEVNGRKGMESARCDSPSTWSGLDKLSVRTFWLVHRLSSAAFTTLSP